jgi:uncharacterized protein with HEPN domain
VYLLHVRDAIERIKSYTAAGRTAFFGDSKTQDAVVRNLEIIGEAVKHVSETLKSAHGGVPWKRVAGMRDKLIHEYFGVNLDLVWEVVERALPTLQRSVDESLRASSDPG